jgi:hypothetical protein
VEVDSPSALAMSFMVTASNFILRVMAPLFKVSDLKRCTDRFLAGDILSDEWDSQAVITEKNTTGTWIVIVA